MCKAWRLALGASRWPLWRLKLVAEQPADAPSAALWAQRLQPGVRQLEIELGGAGSDGDSADESGSKSRSGRECEIPLDAWLSAENELAPAAEAAQGALLALQPRSVSGGLVN